MGAVRPTFPLAGLAGQNSAANIDQISNGRPFAECGFVVVGREEAKKVRGCV